MSSGNASEADSQYYSNQTRKQLASSVLALSKTEQGEVFKIMKQCEIPYTVNKNGVFFNLSSVPHSTVHQLACFIKFCNQNKVHLDEHDKRMSACKLHSVLNPGVTMQAEHARGPNCGVDVWARVCEGLEPRERDRLSFYYDLLTSQPPHASAAAKKKVCTKFNMAKKRYAKRVVSERCELWQLAAGGGPDNSVLSKDAYLLSAR